MGRGTGGRETVGQAVERPAGPRLPATAGAYEDGGPGRPAAVGGWSRIAGGGGAILWLGVTETGQTALAVAVPAFPDGLTRGSWGWPLPVALSPLAPSGGCWWPAAVSCALPLRRADGSVLAPAGGWSDRLLLWGTPPDGGASQGWRSERGGHGRLTFWEERPPGDRTRGMPLDPLDPAPREVRAVCAAAPPRFGWHRPEE